MATKMFFLDKENCLVGGYIAHTFENKNYENRNKWGLIWFSQPANWGFMVFCCRNFNSAPTFF